MQILRSHVGNNTPRIRGLPMGANESVVASIGFVINHMRITPIHPIKSTIADRGGNPQAIRLQAMPVVQILRCRDPNPLAALPFVGCPANPILFGARCVKQVIKLILRIVNNAACPN
jgi:hypothetical protein